MSIRFLLPLALLLALPAQAQLTFTDAFPGISFDSPVEMAQAPGQPERVYVVEQGQAGRARIMTMEAGDSAATVYLDLDDRVSTSGQEMGLLGLAFHPEYETNGRVFAHYTANSPRRSVVMEFARSTSDTLTADPASGVVILEVEQPFSNHNGGKMTFGPDGFLYLGIGDGGSGGDPFGNGQNTDTLLGSILRLDVDDVPEGEAYGIPTDNPFVSGGGRGEIYAYGIRNPWKFSFDSETGDLWLGDVGQDVWEEIDIVQNGGNYGWDITEGPACYNSSNCDLSAYEAPVFWYPHAFSGTAGGFSITGGVVYRGTSVAGLEGLYLYGDFVRPRLWALSYDEASGEASTTLLTTLLSGISSINYGPGGEAYVVTYGGTIYTLGGIVVGAEAGAADQPLAMRAEGPNPFRGSTALTLGSATPVRVTLYDARGRELALLHDGVAPTGTRLLIDAEALSLAPGVVFVVAESEDARRVQRMVVLK